MEHCAESTQYCDTIWRMHVVWHKNLSKSVCNLWQVIKAEDTGGLSSTATVNIKVTDINDKNPEFTDLPYLFRVNEGEANKKVGSVHAVDADEGQNAVIYYTVPEDIPFNIDAMTGEIRTKMALDYERQRVSWQGDNCWIY